MAQQVEFLWRKVGRRRTARYRSSGEVDGKLAKLHSGRSLGQGYSPKCCAYSSQKFWRAEWFCDEIVSPGIERCHFVRFGLPDCKHDNCNVRVVSDGLADLDTAHIRHIDVQKNQIG